MHSSEVPQHTWKKEKKTSLSVYITRFSSINRKRSSFLSVLISLSLSLSHTHTQSIYLSTYLFHLFLCECHLFIYF